jgi:alpha-glucosidase
MDGWMCDFGEWLPTDAVLSDGSSPVAGHQTYPNAWHDLCRTVADERTGGDYATFSRSGWLGEQGVAQIVWIGDQEADFLPSDGLPTVVPAMINLGLTGMPFVTHDIAGFSGGPSTKELWLRWCELGAFTPIMRTHEGLKRSLNWNWDGDAETTAHFRRFARIHELLLPELLALAAEAANTSLPMLRHLTLVFPDDDASRTVADQFMLGDTLLVAPVVAEGATTKQVYLPPGTWFHVWTGDMHVGPITLEVLAPMGSPPVFSLGVDRPDLRAIDGL